MAVEGSRLAITILNKLYLRIPPTNEEVDALQRLAETEAQKGLPPYRLARSILYGEAESPSHR